MLTTRVSGSLGPCCPRGLTGGPRGTGAEMEAQDGAFSQGHMGSQGAEGVSGTQAVGKERSGVHTLSPAFHRAAAQRE